MGQDSVGVWNGKTEPSSGQNGMTCKCYLCILCLQSIVTDHSECHYSHYYGLSLQDIFTYLDQQSCHAC